MGKFSKQSLLTQVVNSSNPALNLLVRAHAVQDLADDVVSVEDKVTVAEGLLDAMESSSVGREILFERELTDAEVTTMYTTPATLIAAPGAGKFIEITTDPIFVVKYGTAAFSGGGTITIRSGTTTITAALSTANSLLAVADRASFVGLLDTANGITFTLNGAITITNATGVFSQGTSTSKLIVKFKYRIHTI